VRPETVLVLTPARSFLATTLEAVWPVLAVAAGTLAVLVPLGLRTTRRLAARITAVERHVARIADGEFGQTLAADHEPGTNDEMSRLVEGVNHMSVQLGALRHSLVAGERQRLLGQLAAGFAHELRNAITGARLAIDLDSLAPGMVVADVIFNPVRTRLLDDAAARGCRTIDGLGMLVNQGIVGVGYWTGVEPDAAVMRTALEAAMGL
jgi:signal transduction histidine kinase